MTMTTLTSLDLRAALPRPRQLLKISPATGAPHWVALRAGLSIGLPLLALWLTGRLGWSLYAAFGAFASLYGRDTAVTARLRMQLQAGTALTLAVAAGVAVGCCADRRWLAVGAAACCAFTGSLAGDRLQWHPVGPLFLVFGLAAVAARPSTPGQLPVALAVTAGTALAATVIGTAASTAASRSGLPRRGPAASPAASPREKVTPQAAWQSAQASRHAVAVLLSGTAATAIGIGHPYWAMVAAVAAVTGADTAARLTRAVHRMAGTLAGVLIAAALLAPHLPLLAIIAIVAVLQFATELCVSRNYALAVLFLTPLALLMGTLSQPVSAWSLVHDRAIETIFGVTAGIAVSLATHAFAPGSFHTSPAERHSKAAGSPAP